MTAAQMAMVDRVAMDEYGVDLLQMMENAGGALARVVQSLWPERSRVIVLAGGGGNGGGALAAARRLQGFGREVAVILDRPLPSLAGAVAHHAATLRAMGIEFLEQPDDDADAVMVDGLIGYGLDRAPRGLAAELIDWSREAGAVLSLDVPSGVDATTGQKHDPHVAPQVTVTLALPKTGLSTEATGKLLLADIGIPAALYSHLLGVDTIPIFRRGDIVDVSGAALRPIS